jgi:hypothetical protein
MPVKDDRDDESEPQGTVSVLALEPLSDDEVQELIATPGDESELREAQLKVLAHETDIDFEEDPADAGAMIGAFDQALAVRVKREHR